MGQDGKLSQYKLISSAFKKKDFKKKVSTKMSDFAVVWIYYIILPSLISDSKWYLK